VYGIILMQKTGKPTGKALALSAMLLFVLTSCINIKSDYPSIEYYRLKQMDNPNINTGTMNGLFQIRDFTIGVELETNYLLALWDDNTIQRYNYHRWIGNCSEMITDFFITRYNNNNAFSEGVIPSSSVLIPKYVMEGQVLDMMAHNSSTDNNANWVNLSIRVNIIRLEPLKMEKPVIHSKVYNTRIQRANNSVATIPPAYSRAFSELADLIMKDIQQAIVNDGRNNSKDTTKTATPVMKN